MWNMCLSALIHKYGHILASLFMLAVIPAICHSERSEESQYVRQSIAEEQILRFPRLRGDRRSG